MKLSFRAFACTFCIFIFSNHYVHASQYVPWQNNDYAIFTSISSVGKQQTLSIDDTASVWRHLTAFSGFGPTWLYSSANSEVVKLYSPDSIAFQNFIDFSQAVGATNSIDILPCNTGQVVIAEKGTSIKVQAGSFQDVIRLDLETNCADAGVTSIWFAKDIGIIQWTEQNIAGAITYQLSQASIAGQLYPASQGVDLIASFPALKIVISTALPVIQETPNATLTLQIQNNTPDPVTYNFPNASRYDITIRDSEGSEVARLSNGLNYAQVVGEVTIPPGGKYYVRDSIELLDNTGNVLPSGQYEFEISLTSYNPVKASQVIEIENPGL